MKAEQFVQTLRQFKHREPFEPFVVELFDGRVIEILYSSFVLCDGAASLLTPTFELVEFACEEVRAIRSWYNASEVPNGGRSHMTAEHFEQTLLQFLRRRPFEPLVVELLDGQLIEIPSPRVIVGGGAATLISGDFEHTDFYCKEVRAIRAVAREGSA